MGEQNETVQNNWNNTINYGYFFVLLQKRCGAGELAH